MRMRTLPVAPLAAAFALTMHGCQPAPPNVYVSQDTPYGEEGLRVTGKAVIRANPDLAVLRLGCTFTGSRAQDARRRTESTIARVIAAMLRHGVAAKDVRTETFTLDQTYDPLRQARYWRSSTILEVRLRNVQTAGAVLDAALDAGANDVRGIDFTIEALEKLRAQAREEACRVAKEKAEQVTRALGARLGQPVAIREFSGDEGWRRMRFANAQVARESISAAPAADGAVAAGTVGVELTVEVVYRLER
jgi:uncharacterized protein YggE